MSEYFNKLRKYNYWEGETIRIGFRRDGYLEKMVSYTGNSLIKVLTGQRRTGKSYLLRQMIEKLIASGINPINICYFNKEIIEFDGVDDFQALHDLITEYRTHFQPLGRVYLFLDEIQLIDGWEKLVNSYSQDYVEAFEIFLTGSNSVMFSGELATLLSGRYVTIEVSPLRNIVNSKTRKKPNCH
jgi:predicted AAA+ superfamily ATPase